MSSEAVGSRFLGESMVARRNRCWEEPALAVVLDRRDQSHRYHLVLEATLVPLPLDLRVHVSTIRNYALDKCLRRRSLSARLRSRRFEAS